MKDTKNFAPIARKILFNFYTTGGTSLVQKTAEVQKLFSRNWYMIVSKLMCSQLKKKRKTQSQHLNSILSRISVAEKNS